jgi:serine/threonine-protein kinase
MAPEQITSFREARPPADQFAAAATLYNLLTGKMIHDVHPNVNLMIARVLTEDPVPILQRRPDLPPGLAAVIHKALQRDPQDRYPDVRALRQELLPFGS